MNIACWIDWLSILSSDQDLFKQVVIMAEFIRFTIVALTLAVVASVADAWFTNQIHAYHFHTYFFQQNPESVNEALRFR